MTDTAKPDLLMIVPSRGTTRIEWAIMFRMIASPTNMTSEVQVVEGKGVVEARNIAAKYVMDRGAEWLFFLDDDTFCGPQVMRSMHNKMAQNPDWDMLTGITPMKTPDCEPNIYVADKPGAYWDWTFGDIFPVDACGLSCALIRRSALEKVGEPWFGWKSGHDPDGAYTEMGEDIGFCTKLREAGGTIMADGGAICGHMDTTGKLYQFPDTAAPFQRAQELLAKSIRAQV